MYPRHKHVDYAYYIKGLANYDEYITFLYQQLPMDRAIRDPQDAKKAFSAFKKLLEFYPNSIYVCDAKARMIYLKNHLARHELHIAEYYFEREAYLAAANRCQYILEYYDKTPSIPKALKLQIQAYQKLGLNKLACEYQSILDKNFTV
jgi:outer membrane protein assembly factor BamD